MSPTRSAPGSPHPVRHLYIHVPFCARKCQYCAFYSEAASAALTDRYVAALLRELDLTAPDLTPDTIFFGGGTPTLLSLQHWELILDKIHTLFPAPPSEWTIEANPATLSLDKARLLRSAGVNRISLGIQSLDEQLLDRLGRVHSRDMALRSFDTLRQAGFANVNVDLMFAIPGQSLHLWRHTLREALALGSEHLSCYEVTYEEDTPLYDQLHAGQFDVDEDLACAMYEELRTQAADAGFVQYEVANFARPSSLTPARIPDRACRHNVNYWRGGPFHGLGPSASGFIHNVRTKNWSNTQLYCEQLEKGRRAIESHDHLPPLARAAEIAAFGLRMVAGWDFDEFTSITGFDLRRDWAAELQSLVQLGHGEFTPSGFRLTHTGLRFADAAAQRLLRDSPGNDPASATDTNLPDQVGHGHPEHEEEDGGGPGSESAASGAGTPTGKANQNCLHPVNPVILSGIP